MCNEGSGLPDLITHISFDFQVCKSVFITNAGRLWHSQSQLNQIFKVLHHRSRKICYLEYYKPKLDFNKSI